MYHVVLLLYLLHLFMWTLYARIDGKIRSHELHGISIVSFKGANLWKNNLESGFWSWSSSLGEFTLGKSAGNSAFHGWDSVSYSCSFLLISIVYSILWINEFSPVYMLDTSKKSSNKVYIDFPLQLRCLMSTTPRFFIAFWSSWRILEPIKNQEIYKLIEN